ncbi:PepSY-like domain-containing protein [uncultured Brachyspira sp.]|uniref:PepSY-like domain-containing protein n=1 Tax=uncultured Brachyspira sp. TaxID=221953 RepID=UPI0026361370|nr:PepSY-like domain-containing protein [uncultured Brachyspira sp.]
MKKLFCLLFAFSIIGSSSLFADWIVPISQVPAAVKNAVKRRFPRARIWKVEMDDGLYHVELSNGVELEVTRRGRIVDIDY